MLRTVCKHVQTDSLGDKGIGSESILLNKSLESCVVSFEFVLETVNIPCGIPQIDPAYSLPQ